MLALTDYLGQPVCVAQVAASAFVVASVIALGLTALA
jgi:hypothetical protein